MTDFDNTHPVLLVKSKAGRLIGCCSRHCYDDEDFRCTCICGGVNHGVGRRQAARNVLDGIKVDWSATWAKLPKSTCQVIIPRGTQQQAEQTTLFQLDPRD